jgi:hypothetical protein
MLDPQIAAAMVTASGALIGKLLELSGKRNPTAQARNVIEKTYGRLSDEAITTNSVRILRALRQAGSKQSEGMLYPVVEAMRERQEPIGKRFETVLTYRLKYLCLLGLVRQTQDEYALTDLGAAFLAKASEDNLNYRSAFVA